MLKKALDTYNSIYHRGIGMSPKEGLDPGNREKVKQHEEKYKSEFENKLANKTNNKNIISIGKKVLLKNEIKSNKMDKDFKLEGVIVGKLGENSFKVRLDNGKELIRHCSQLKPINI